ncbi:preprotein translocase subunit YajC [Alloprevotella sp. Lung230]|uniref:preprotein translocase subunit YajC n=1 Tax=Alloprevotella sp. Lung230 TaxID=2766595 RepID=UPI001655798B|nr:preprotein translocase subunit YajC [Alloprevotella sp. Lung230]MBC8625798.1 preprotein translocase subunit YajC [Alloprevotella sp. Lung230]
MNFTLLAAAQQGSMWTTILMMVALFAIMYFFMIRPQQKKQKEVNRFRDALAVGQDVVTIGGIHGTIKNIDGNIITLKVATGVDIRVEKAAINPNGTQPAQA